MEVTLRPVSEFDLDDIFEFQLDPEANRMAAFTAKDPSDRAAFDAHWKRILADPSLVTKAVIVDGELVGTLGKFEMFDRPQVTYWIDKAHWGRGIATAALARFLSEFDMRPLYGQAASDNAASIRVLEKCGFREVGRDSGYANARGREIEEVILILEQ